MRSLRITPRFTIGDVTVREGDAGTRTVWATASLSEPSYRPVTVAFGTFHRTASAANRYQPTQGTITFEPGTRSRQIGIPIVPNRTDEPDAKVFVIARTPYGVSAARPTATVAVLDDDGTVKPVNVSIDDTAVTEGDSARGTLAFTITLSARVAHPVSVTVATVAGTADGGSDFERRSTRVVIPAFTLGSRWIVDIAADTVAESDEAFYVHLSDPNGAAIGRANGKGTIVDDD